MGKVATHLRISYRISKRAAKVGKLCCCLSGLDHLFLKVFTEDQCIYYLMYLLILYFYYVSLLNCFWDNRVGREQ